MTKPIAALIVGVLLAVGCGSAEPVTPMTPEQTRTVERACMQWRAYERDLSDSQAEICIAKGLGR